VGSVTDYGRLSRLSREEMITLSAQHGADPNDPRKQDPLDFVLWQASAPDEPRWESPGVRGDLAGTSSVRRWRWSTLVSRWTCMAAAPT